MNKKRANMANMTIIAGYTYVRGKRQSFKILGSMIIFGMLEDTCFSSSSDNKTDD